MLVVYYLVTFTILVSSVIFDLMKTEKVKYIKAFHLLKEKGKITKQ